MAFSFEPFLAISAGHFMAVSAGPEQCCIGINGNSGENYANNQKYCEK